jgi:hypothetical protein
MIAMTLATQHTMHESGPKGVIRSGFAIGCGRELEAVLLVVTNG